MSEPIEKIDIKVDNIEPSKSFEEELCSLINRYSKENDSNTPDFILRKYLVDCLKAFNKATNRRTSWYQK